MNIAEWVKSELRTEPTPEAEPVEKQTVAPRIAVVCVELLDEVAVRTGRTRTGLAGELLELAIIEAGRAAGMGIFPAEEPGVYEVGFMISPEVPE